MKIVKNEKGFVVSVTAIIIAVILGLSILYISNSIAINVTSSANSYSTSQAKWSAVSGIEHTILRLNSGSLDYINGTYPFYNGNIIIDTTTIDPANQVMQITSTGMHSNSIRILSIRIEPVESDTAIEEGFEDDEGFDYDDGPGNPGPHVWGFTCSGEIPNGQYPTYVLQGADSCFFFGTKIKNNSSLSFAPVGTDDNQTWIFNISLAAGIDVPQEWLQQKFLPADFLSIKANGIPIEYWNGDPGKSAMHPRIGNTTMDLPTNFENFSFNLTDILGEVDSVYFVIEAMTNQWNKYIGIEGISLIGLGGWTVLDGAYTEI